MALQVRRLEAAVRANKPTLVQGAAPRVKGEAPEPDAQQGSLTNFIRKSPGALAPAPAPEQAAGPASAPPTPAAAVAAAESPEGHFAKRTAPRACPACTLETEDGMQAKCEACGCELDPPSSAKRRKPDAAAGAHSAPSPHRRSIQSFFSKKPSPDEVAH